MHKSTSILILVENLAVPFDRRVWMEATTLKRNGYQVHVICPQGNGFEKKYEIIDGIHIYRHPLPAEESSVIGYLREYSWALYWQFTLARKVWKEAQFDIIHICNPPDLLFLVAIWFKLLKGVKVLFDHHDLAPEMYIAKYDRKDIFYYALRLVERLTYIFSDYVIATNESHHHVAITRGAKKPERVFIVRSAPDLSDFFPLPADTKYKHGRKYLVGYVGVIGEPEGVDHLLRAIRYITHERKRTDIHFMLIGDGPALYSLKELVGKLDIQEYVDFAGFQRGKELLKRLSSCDVCVEPSPGSAYNENCTMNKILEYMALGKPIVQFELRENKRSAQSAALYATPNDEIEFANNILKLLDDASLREHMGNEGRRRMKEELEWKHQAPKLLRAYQAISMKR